MPKIENWFPMAGGLVGKVSGHDNQETFHSHSQLTSIITEANEEEGYVITESGTRYELGKRHESFTGKKIPVMSRR